MIRIQVQQKAYRTISCLNVYCTMCCIKVYRQKNTCVKRKYILTETVKGETPQTVKGENNPIMKTCAAPINEEKPQPTQHTNRQGQTATQNVP